MASPNRGGTEPMPRPSSIDKLDPQIRDLIGQLRDRGRTLDEIRARLSDMLGEDAPSRSALHRHIQGLDEIAEEMRRARTMAEALVRGIGDEPESKVAQLNIQLAHTALFKMLSNDGQVVRLDPEEAMLAASAIQKLTSASKTDNDLRTAIRKEVAAMMAKELDEEARTNKGLTADMVASLKARFLGIKATG